MDFSQWLGLLATVLSVPGAVVATVTLVAAARKRKGKM